MSRNRVIIGLLFILLLVMGLRLRQSLEFPKQSQAQEAPANVGPHAAFFDPGGNIQVAGMVKSKTPANLPITLMVGITAPVSEISSIVSAGSGLRIMLRVTGVDVNTTASQAQAIAQSLNGAGIPPGTLVVFGNELNNLDKEWKSCSAACPGGEGAAGAAYGNLFRAFRSAASGGWIPVPAPPDMYNGVYGWQPFVQSAGVYDGPLVANVYDIDLTLWQQLGNVVAFTEYGPDPNKSLQEHIDFFLNNPLPAGIQMATTLIPDKCDPNYTQGADMWLYYIQGKLYDRNGNEVNPANCEETAGETKESQYHRFVYPFYSNDQNVMLEELTEDYDVSCVPPSNYTAGVGGDVNKLINFFGCSDGLSSDGNACFFSPEGTKELTVAGNRIFGTLRDELQAKNRYDRYPLGNFAQRMFTNRFESVEEWWGANNPPGAAYMNETPADGISELHQGPFYKLADEKMQCMAAADILSASANLCDEWNARKNGDIEYECPLSTWPVAGVTNGSYDTLGELASAIPGSGDDKYRAFCESYYEKVDAEPGERREAPVRSATEKALREAMSKVDLFMEVAYRPAFLVAVTEVDDPEFGRPERQKMLGIRQDGRETVQATDHIVDYLVYHVPASLTDTDLGPDFKDNPSAYSDVIKNTAKLITPQQDIDQFNQKVEDYRAQVKSVVDARQGTSIRCAEPECLNEPLRKALITYLNAILSQNLNFKYQEGKPESFDLSCEDQDESDDSTRRESGRQLGSPLEPTDSFEDITTAKDYFGMGLGSTSIDTINTQFKLDQYFERSSAIRNPRVPQPKTKLYNISPHRANADFVAQRMDSLFTTEQQENQFNQDKGYFDKFEALIGSAFTVKEHTRQYTEVIYPPIPGATPFTVTQQVPGTILEQHEEPQSLRFEWMAKIFNRSTRAVAQLLFKEGTAPLDCARNNANPENNTEEFLRNCQNKGVGAPVGGSTIPGAQCTIAGGFNIQSNIVKNLMVDAGRKYNVPVQVMMATLWTENCRSQTVYNGMPASVCDKADDYLSQLPGGVYPNTAGCPGQTRNAGTGIFQVNLTYWQTFADPSMKNACGLQDSFYGAARWLSANYSSFGSGSAIGQAPPATSWSTDKMKEVVSKWAANTASCSGHPFARLYCCVIDQLTTGVNSCGESWINQLTPIQTTCN